MTKIFTLCFLIFAGIGFLSPTAGAQDKNTKKKAEKPYVIHERTSKINRADIRKDSRGTENIIQIDATNASGGVGTFTTRSALPPAEISNIILVSGNYNLTRELAKTSRGMSMQLMDVVFPCRIRLTVSNETFEFEIKEAGFWKVSLSLIN
jgi:hypothetical protein